MNDKSAIQEALYRFPYHYIPSCDDQGNASRHRGLRWGFDYLCCLRHITAAVMQAAPASLLDVGCGDGRLPGMLHEAGMTGLSGCDISARAIAMAAAFNPQVRFICSDAAGLDETFAMVTCIEVLEHIADQHLGNFTAGLARRVAPGGNLLVSVPTCNRPLSKKHYRHYTGQLLLEHLAPAKHGLVVESVEHVFNGRDPLYRFYTRLTSNRFWFVGIAWLEKLMWQRVWNNLRHARPDNGFHLLMNLKRVA